MEHLPAQYLHQVKRRCQIMVQFESGKTSFFKCQKKETLMHKINSKWYCWMYGARILQKNSPDHLFKVIRWSGAVLTFCSPKKLLFLQKSLFLDGAQTQIYNLFMKKLRHRLSALPQPYCRLLGSPLSSLRAAYQPCSSPAAGFCSQPPTWCHFRQGVSQKCWGS